MKKRRLSLQDKAWLAIKEAVREVVRNHKKSGRPLPIWKDGRVVLIRASKL